MKKYIIMLGFCFFSSIILAMNQKITLPSKEALDEEFKKLVSYPHIKSVGIIEAFAEKELFPIQVISDVSSCLLKYYEKIMDNRKGDVLNALLAQIHLNRSLNKIKRILLKDYPDIIRQFEQKGAIEVEQ